jgi:hypothetical protein
MTSIGKCGAALLWLAAVSLTACGGPERAEPPGTAAERQAINPNEECLTNADCGNPCLKCVGGIPGEQYGTCEESSGYNAYSTRSSCVVESYFCTLTPPVVGSKGSGCTYEGCKAVGGGQYSCQQNACYGPTTTPPCDRSGALSCAQLCAYF